MQRNWKGRKKNPSEKQVVTSPQIHADLNKQPPGERKWQWDDNAVFVPVRLWASPARTLPVRVTGWKPPGAQHGNSHAGKMAGALAQLLGLIPVSLTRVPHHSKSCQVTNLFCLYLTLILTGNNTDCLKQGGPNASIAIHRMCGYHGQSTHTHFVIIFTMKYVTWLTCRTANWTSSDTSTSTSDTGSSAFYIKHCKGEGSRPPPSQVSRDCQIVVGVRSRASEGKVLTGQGKRHVKARILLLG